MSNASFGHHVDKNAFYPKQLANYLFSYLTTSFQLLSFFFC